MPWRQVRRQGASPDIVQTSEEDAREWLVRARRGDLAAAWEASDRILRRHIQSPDYSRPRHEQSIWRGEPLEGKRVLIRCYHGLGDTIQFIRYAPMLRGVARKVVVWAQPPLIPLLESVRGIDRLLPLTEGTPDVSYDVDLEVMELPFIFRTTLATIPRDIPYLSVQSPRLPRAAVAGPPPRIGLTWRSGDWHTSRSIPFEMLHPLFELTGVTWCSVQQHRGADESHPALIDISHDDLHEAARRVAALDLLITVDSMPAHLAGALGVPVWTLLLEQADWRWMEERADTPWYPTMRLFRQDGTGDWAPVVGRVAAALRAGDLETGAISERRPPDSGPPG